MRIAKAPFVSLVITAALESSAHANCGAPLPLERPVAGFSTGNVAALEAIWKLGREYQICFAVEELDRDLFGRKVDLSVNSEPVAAVLKRILSTPELSPPYPPYRILEKDGVVVLSRPRPPAQTWLDYKLPLFKTPRGPIQEINNALRLSLLWHTRPGIKGIAGRYRAGVSGAQAGPFEEKNSELRRLLNLLLKSSPAGGIWVVHRPATRNGPAPLEEFWTLLDYSEPIEISTALLSAILAAP